MLRRTIAIVLMVAGLATACSSGGDSEDGGARPPTSTSPTTSTTTTTVTMPSTTIATTTTTTVPTDESDDAVLAAVERFWEVVIDANNPPDPDSPLWDEVAAGDYVDLLRSNSGDLLAQGQALRHPATDETQVRQPRVLSNDGKLAVVELCRVNNTIAYEIDSGSIVDDRVIFEHRQHILELIDEGWRVTATNLVDELEGLDSCIAALP